MQASTSIIRNGLYQMYCEMRSEMRPAGRLPNQSVVQHALREFGSYSGKALVAGSVIYLGAAAPLGIALAVAGFAAFYFSKRVPSQVKTGLVALGILCYAASTIYLMIRQPVKLLVCGGGVLLGLFLRHKMSSNQIAIASIGRPGEALNAEAFTQQLHQIAHLRALRVLHIHHNAALALTPDHIRDIGQILPEEIHLTEPLEQVSLEALNRSFPLSAARELTFYYSEQGGRVLRKAIHSSAVLDESIRGSSVSFIQQYAVAWRQHIQNQTLRVQIRFNAEGLAQLPEVPQEILNALTPLGADRLSFYRCRVPEEYRNSLFTPRLGNFYICQKNDRSEIYIKGTISPQQAYVIDTGEALNNAQLVRLLEPLISASPNLQINHHGDPFEISREVCAVLCAMRPRHVRMQRCSISQGNLLEMNKALNSDAKTEDFFAVFHKNRQDEMALEIVKWNEKLACEVGPSLNYSLSDFVEVMKVRKRPIAILKILDPKLVLTAEVLEQIRQIAPKVIIFQHLHKKLDTTPLTQAFPNARFAFADPVAGETTFTFP